MRDSIENISQLQKKLNDLQVGKSDIEKYIGQSRIVIP